MPSSTRVRREIQSAHSVSFLFFTLFVVTKILKMALTLAVVLPEESAAASAADLLQRIAKRIITHAASIPAFPMAVFTWVSARGSCFGQTN